MQDYRYTIDDVRGDTSFYTFSDQYYPEMDSNPIVNSRTSPLDLVFAAKVASTATCGLVLGSTTWASLAVMPSLIAAPISTNAKLSVFDGLIVRANRLLPPVIITAASSLAYLTYASPPTSAARRSFLVATLAMMGSLGLQAVVVPKNNAMQDIVREGRGRDDSGADGNRRVEELRTLNTARFLLSAAAFGLGLLELRRGI